MVALGGAIGAILRFIIGTFAVERWGTTFPWGTLIVNLVGSFVIGFSWQLFERWAIAPQARTFLFIGLLGAFTTFSSYALDTIRLYQSGKQFLAIANVLANNVLGLTAVLLGFLLARQIISRLR